MPGLSAARASFAPRPARVEAHGWGWRHASRNAWAVRDVSFRIEPGERVLLLGASGSGKSTLLHGLAGVLGGDEEGESSGALLVDGEPAAAARGRSGLVLQDPDSQVILARVGDDVAFGCENLGVPREEIWQRVGEALDAVGLDVPLDRPTKALSGGQKQRLALAGAVAMRPGLLLLDEPTANLDPEGVAAVRAAVQRSLERNQATLVVVEHRVEVWLPLVTRVIVLGDGGVVADGDPEEVLGREGERLAQRGVWVPGIPPALPPPPDRAPGESLLRASGLSVARVARHPVATDISLEVRAGVALAITGPNGAGKSTLGLTLAGLLAPAAGRVVASDVLADGAGEAPIRWSSRALLTRIGTVFQDPEHQLLAKTVREELEIGPRAWGLDAEETARRVDELLVRLRLDALARANPYTLSGGEKRRLTVAAALATRPRVLVLDEPTFGQDARTWAELVALLAGLRDAGSAIVTITHDLDVVAALRAERFELPGAAGEAV
jgi:energy-coupling factor transport system ATP-binding protein